MKIAHVKKYPYCGPWSYPPKTDKRILSFMTKLAKEKDGKLT
jgi:hypothetical protein